MGLVPVLGSNFCICCINCESSTSKNLNHWLRTIRRLPIYCVQMWLWDEHNFWLLFPNVLVLICRYAKLTRVKIYSRVDGLLKVLAFLPKTAAVGGLQEVGPELWGRPSNHCLFPDHSFVVRLEHLDTFGMTQLLSQTTRFLTAVDKWNFSTCVHLMRQLLWKNIISWEETSFFKMR